MTTNKIEFDTKRKKGRCPQCNHDRVFRYYVGLPDQYGICDRANNCGYHKKPEPGINILAGTTTPAMAEPEILTPDPGFINKLISRQNTHFHSFCVNALNIPPENFTRWGIGSHDEKTAFILQNKAGAVNVKYMIYNQNGKRDKGQNPYYLKARSNAKYNTCLFGEHLLTDEKTVCLVESEKTAFIASFFYPAFQWLATGGSNGLTNRKLATLQGRKIYLFTDADKAGRESSTIEKLRLNKLDFTVIDLFKDKTDGYDLADALTDGLRPDIAVEIRKVTGGVAENANKEKKGKVENSFTILKDYLMKIFDLQYNEVRNEIEYKAKSENEFKQLNENDIYAHLKENNVYFKKDDLKAILGSSIITQYNPIDRYFQSLSKWDGKTDHITTLISHIEYNGTVDIKNHFKKWLVRSVKCALEPAYFNKQIFVLIGKQNDGKSTFCRFLVPVELEAYYTENPDFKSKDGEITLSQNFLINMDELANIGHEDTNKLKTFISKNSTNIRRPYAKNQTRETRRANFLGTTNNDEFLTDHTGNVRWLNFKIEGINFDYSKSVNINDVWSQAYELYKTGFKCEITKEEMQEIEYNNSLFKIQTPEMQLIQQCFKKPDKQDITLLKELTATEIVTHIQTVYPNQKNLNIIKIGKAMSSLGYSKVSVRTTGQTPVYKYLVYFC